MEGTRYRRLRRTCVAIRAESDTADRRPSFRGMSATDSENAQNSGRIPVGISGRVPSEWVADLRRNQWPGWVGIRSSILNSRILLIAQFKLEELNDQCNFLIVITPHQRSHSLINVLFAPLFERFFCGPRCLI